MRPLYVYPPIPDTSLKLLQDALPTNTHTMSFISMGDVDLLHPPKELEQRRHKLKRLVQSPNSFFMDVKCPGCFTINTVQT